ncbi:hypothetical protein ACFL18_01820 [Patescibacteria group bacterium]
MAIANDWDIDFISKVISHVDGVLAYGSNTGTAPADGDYVRGNTSTAIGKIIGGTDLGGSSATGTLTLTNVVGKFQSGENLTVMDRLLFDQVQASNGGFKVGDTLDENGAGTASIIVYAIEYNIDATAGDGYIYGVHSGESFTDGDQLDVNGGTADVAYADAAEDTAATFSTAATTATLAVPGTANTNDSVIIHYDGGTIDIPEGASITETGAGTATGIAQQVYGVTATGSIRIVDNDSSGDDWTDDNTIDIQQVVFYDTQVAGQVFSAGDVVVNDNASPGTGRVLAVIDDGDSSGKLILADKSGTWAVDDEISVGGVAVADVENTTEVLAAVATVNIPGGIRKEQRKSQGGIYAGTDSLNIVRSFNALYTYLQDYFDELGQLDDNEPMTAQVKDQAYTLVNDWQIPDLSMRFLESGSLKDSGNNNIFANIQTLGTIADITNQGFLYDTNQKTPQPNFYIEQNGLVLDQSWLEGNINVLVKVKTKTDTRYIDPTVNTLGQLINSGIVTVFAREYLRTYDHFQFTNTTGGFVAVPLATADDLDNNTGQYTFSYNTGGAETMVVGEEIYAGLDTVASPLKVGIVTAQTGDGGATGTVTYVLKSATQFAAADVCEAAVSSKAITLTGAVTNVVAGYGTNVRAMTIDQKITGDGGAGTFIVGETVTQVTSGATGYFMELDGNDMYIQKLNATAFTTNNLTITGATSGATHTHSSAFVIDTNQLTVPKAIDGETDLNYKAVISGDITDAAAQTIQVVYEWCKFLTRSESTSTEGGPGSTAGINGQIYRTLDSSFAEKKASPYGTFAGGTMFGAQGVFIDKDTLATADVKKISLLDNLGATVTPPDTQSLTVTSLVSGDRVAVYRSTGAGATTIMTTEWGVGTIGGGNNESADDTVLVQAGTRALIGGKLPNDVPDAAVLRIEIGPGTEIFTSYTYTSVSRSTLIFTLSGTLATTLTLADDVFVALIEEQAAATSITNTIVYVADINLLIRVRVKGILPFQTTSTFGSSGASIGAVRTTDSIVDLP